MAAINIVWKYGKKMSYHTIFYFLWYGNFFTIQYFQRYCMVMAYHIPYAYNIVKNSLIRGRSSSGWMMANEMTLP